MTVQPALDSGGRMDTPASMETARDPRRCHAHSKQSGEPCGNWSLPGQTVCKFHGGGTAASKRKAALRLLALVDPAVATIAREMTNQAGTPMSRLRAAENVLDRAGFPRKVDGDPDTARAMLLDRLRELAEAQAEARRAEDTVIEGEVVE